MIAMPERRRLNHRGPLSIDVSSSWYFITICAAERCDYGRAVSTKPPPTPFMIHASAILDAARFRHLRGKWRLAVFLIMPDHIHLIAHFPSITLDAAVSSKPPYRGMEHVIADFKRWLSTKYRLRFQRDFFDTRLRDDAHFAKEYKYILGNPVRKGLCAAPEEWPYSLAFNRADGTATLVGSRVPRGRDGMSPSPCGCVQPVGSRVPRDRNGRAVSTKPPSAELMEYTRSAT